MEQPFFATYALDLPAEEAHALAESILIEQTVETPLAFARRFPFVETHMMGEIVSIEPISEGMSVVSIRLPLQTASVDASQFLNVLFGNVSLHEKVRLVDFSIPPTLAARFTGPGFGLEGLRSATGVPHRALTSTALKPVGLNLDELSGMCETLARGGIDLIKDDHYLANHSFCPFEDRIQACQQAVERAANETGKRAVYAPNLSGGYEDLCRQAESARKIGVQAVMLAPMLVGLPQMAALVREHIGLPVLAHPSFAGATRIAPDVLFGRLFRMFGADAVIFANYGGRFSYSQETCIQIADSARAPWHTFKPAMPVPAGGMTVERSQELVKTFGNDTMLLIGGSLLNTSDLLARTRLMVESVREATQ